MQPAPVQPANGSNYLTIAQIIVSGLGLALALLVAALMGLAGLVGVMSESPAMPEPVPVFALAWVGAVVAMLAVPSLYYSIRRFVDTGIKLPRLPGYRLAVLLVMLWPLVLVLGNRLAANSLAWLFLPPLKVLAIGLPIWFLVEMARRELPIGSHQRGWGVFNFSMFVTTPVTVIAEVIVFVLLGVGVMLWVNAQPQIQQELERLGQEVMNGPGTPEAILEAVRPLLQNPLVVFGILGLLSGLTPLLEELLKPLALWMLVGRRLSPAEGFAAGALCGASFALIESLMTLSSTAEGGWAALAVGRAGTGLLHIATTAMVGWGIASAVSGRKYLRLVLAFLAASAFHGLWNFLSLLTGIAAVLNPAPANLVGLTSLAKVAPAGLVAISVVLFVFLWWANRRLRSSSLLHETAKLNDTPE